MNTPRPWHKVRRVDIMFVIGAVAFVVQLVGGNADRTIVTASLLLMGLPIVNRVDDAVRKNGNGK